MDIKKNAFKELLSSLLLVVATGAAEELRANKSSSPGSVYWATKKDEGKILAMVESIEEPSAAVGEMDEFTGSLSSFDGM